MTEYIMIESRNLSLAKKTTLMDTVSENGGGEHKEPGLAG